MALTDAVVKNAKLKNKPYNLLPFTVMFRVNCNAPK